MNEREYWKKPKMALSTPRDIFRVVWSLFSKDGNGNNF
jgi:hypothetical protein